MSGYTIPISGRITPNVFIVQGTPSYPSTNPGYFDRFYGTVAANQVSGPQLNLSKITGEFLLLPNNPGSYIFNVMHSTIDLSTVDLTHVVSLILYPSNSLEYSRRVQQQSSHSDCKCPAY